VRKKVKGSDEFQRRYRMGKLFQVVRAVNAKERRLELKHKRGTSRSSYYFFDCIMIKTNYCYNISIKNQGKV